MSPVQAAQRIRPLLIAVWLKGNVILCRGPFYRLMANIDVCLWDVKAIQVSRTRSLSTFTVMRSQTGMHTFGTNGIVKCCMGYSKFKVKLNTGNAICKSKPIAWCVSARVCVCVCLCVWVCVCVCVCVCVHVVGEKISSVSFRYLHRSAHPIK